MKDTKPALFIYGDGVYRPFDKNAQAVTAVISKRFLREDDMVLVRCAGYTPYVVQEIGKVNIKV